MDFKPEITKEELSQLKNVSFPGTIYVIDSKKNMDKICNLLKKSNILGFDTETRPAFKKGVHYKVSLLQLSDGENAFLFRLNKTEIPQCVVDILSSDEYIKVGVAIKDDIKGLQAWKQFVPKNFIELQEFTEKFGIHSNSLKKLAGIVLGFSVSKRQRTSNWEKEELSESQLKYAATDAWVCYEIYQKLVNNE